MSQENKDKADAAGARTQGDLILCVPEDCFQRLSANQAKFVNDFVTKTADEHITFLDGDSET